MEPFPKFHGIQKQKHVFHDLLRLTSLIHYQQKNAAIKKKNNSLRYGNNNIKKLKKEHLDFLKTILDNEN